MSGGPMTELDHLRVELRGVNLIEASAGTGKTYAIASLYLRLLLEQDLLPEQILVVTYTEAATKELRSRIRNRITEALRVVDGAPADDPFLLQLCSNCNGSFPSPEQARYRLVRALTSFDTASIFTIHSFCLRALQEHAFESGSLFDTELVSDHRELLQEIADDFWRTWFFTHPAPLAGYALVKGLTPEKLMHFLKEMLDNPQLLIVPRFTVEDVADIETRCRNSFAAVKEEWTRSRAEIEDILLNSKDLLRGAETYRNSDVVPALLEGIVELMDGDNPFALFDGFERCCISSIIAGTRKKGVSPSHHFFVCCEDLYRDVEERFLALKWELVEFAREQLPARKLDGNIRFFDDLLNDLYDALQGERGNVFAAGLRTRHPAALIDEFQDTDPVQYEIFRRIYTDPDGLLLLIGDPKQAIYSFRGADIFAYLQAASHIPSHRRFTLTGNWRSSPHLLTAFNAVFSGRSNPFLFEEITFHSVTSGRPDAPPGLVLEDWDEAPLQVWNLPLGTEGKPLKMTEAQQAIPPAVAAEIARLLEAGGKGKAKISGRPLEPGDIAVVVRSHLQGKWIQEALRELRIPSVMRSDMSIFETDDAREVRILLDALAEPSNEAKVRAALATSILGRSGDDIARLLDDEQGWEAHLALFRECHDMWLDHGFMVMSQELLARERVRGRLLRRPDGERRLTNLLHCCEVIHAAAHEGGLGIEGILAWFGSRISDGETGDEYQIRLETDEMAVKIVTVHVSKGLEYPVVFCPFLWGGVREVEEIATYHDGFIMGKDFGSPHFDAHCIQARRETLAESIRLLYVALTRAKYRCYLVTGRLDGSRSRTKPETSPVSYLIHSSRAFDGAGDTVADLAAEVAAQGPAAVDEQLGALCARGKGSITAAPMPPPAASTYTPERGTVTDLASRSVVVPISADWRVASFTSFAAAEHAAELPDRDEGADTASPAPEPSAGTPSIFTFPKGAQAGIFLHGLFEHLDFTAPVSGAGTSVGKALETSGFGEEWHPVTMALMAEVVGASLPVAEPFTLADLQPGAWKTELEFFFPLRFMTSDTLRESLRRWSGSHLATDLDLLCRSLSFRPVRGMVRGFIDLVMEHGGRYYIVDWKSNHLGYSPSDYNPAALRREMGSRMYTLQYLLYTVALNRYLSLRVPGYDYRSHFGGAMYVFLRGVSADAPGSGIFFDLPPAEMITQLTDVLIDAEGGRV